MTDIQVAVWFRYAVPTLVVKPWARKTLQHVSANSPHPLEVHAIPAVDFETGQKAKIERQVEIANEPFKLSCRRKSL